MKRKNKTYEETVATLLHRPVYGRTARMRAQIVSVRPCKHLTYRCTGLDVELRWADGATSRMCSDLLLTRTDGTYQVAP